jgi:DNA modification methylase
MRRHYFPKEASQHQAKLELRTFKWIVESYTKPGDLILDPMSGAGTIHMAVFMGRNTIAIELVPKFVAIQQASIQNMFELWSDGMEYNDGNIWNSNFYQLPDMGSWDYKAGNNYPPGTWTILEGDNRSWLPLGITNPRDNQFRPLADACIFSPPYGNLWKPDNSKISQEKGYVKGYGDDQANIGNLDNYTAYLTAMQIVYNLVFQSLKPGAPLISVVKDYVKAGKRVLCSRDNLLLCLNAGFTAENWHFRRADVQNNPYSKGNRDKRIAAGKHRPELDIVLEDILVLRKPEVTKTND